MRPLPVMRLALFQATIRHPGFTLGPVSLELEPGLSVLIGPSGSGKSTLLGLLAGLRPPHEGVVHFGGRDIARMRDAERSRVRKSAVSYATQSPVFLDELDLLANISRAVALRGEARSDVMRWIEAVGLGTRAHHLPSVLSGGELSRANTARAFATSCTTLLLDEPTAMLDEANAARVRELIAGEENDRSILVATHDDALIGRAKHVWRIEEGKVTS